MIKGTIAIESANDKAILSIISIFLKNMNEIMYPGRNNTYGVPNVILRDSKRVKEVNDRSTVIIARIAVIISILFFIL